LSMGGQLQMTLASCAMHLFRRRFLSHDISIPAHVNEAARQAYFSSRVEVFQSTCEDAYYYDINSSFPYAMTFPCPGEYIGTQLTLPSRPEVIYIADVEVKVPDSYLPPLPYRMEGRVFFPVGQWRSWLTQVDIELLLENGGQILKVHECMGFEPFDDLKEYAETFYTLRKNATNEFDKVTGKLLMNSLYGKFGESAEKQQMHINPSESTEWRLRDKELEGRAEILFPGAWIETIDADVPHMHVPIAAHITSFARRTLYNFLKPCEQVYYSDTDSVITTSTLPTSKELGGLKLEYRVKGGEFYSPKLYRLHAEENGKEKTVYRAKGFSLDTVDRANSEAVEAEERLRGDERTDRIREINFDKIVNFDEVHIERMTRIRELYRKGRTKPEETTITKGIRNKLVPWEVLPPKAQRSVTKRFMYPDGDSRPWGLDELEDILS
jgi:DNA polymerase family B